MVWTLVLVGAALFLGAALWLALVLAVVVILSVTGLNAYDTYRRREPAVDAAEADGR
jgi:4-hydroxybenzoate polyprenyltransferase